jgi:hypothetical protein
MDSPWPNVDLILHSPGGSGSAAELIVKYLRTKFDHIRIVVPHMAMSAATMVSGGTDEVIMGKHSFLGPIDPQFILRTSLGQRSVPAQAILEQFELAKREAADPAKLRVWAPMLAQYGPDLLITRQNVAKRSGSDRTCSEGIQTPKKKAKQSRAGCPITTPTRHMRANLPR